MFANECTQKQDVHLQQIAGVISWAHRRIGNLPAQDRRIIAVVDAGGSILVQNHRTNILLECFLQRRNLAMVIIIAEEHQAHQ